MLHRLVTIEVTSFTSCKYIGIGCPKIYKVSGHNSRKRYNDPVWKYFVICKMGLSKIYRYTEFEVSSFTRSKFR